jgi:hypothetical protein
MGPAQHESGVHVVLRGAIKVDLFPGDRPHQVAPPWQPHTENLAAIDAHFWEAVDQFVTLLPAAERRVGLQVDRRLREEVIARLRDACVV